MTSYTPPSNKIIHVTSVDFITRQISDPVLLVQYDDTLPILEVHLFQNGVKYNLSSSSNVNIRFKNLDGYKVYNPALGYNSSDTSIVYFNITQTMTVSHGKSFGVVEIGSGNGVANSAPISFVIDKNPIQNSDIDASDDMQSIVAFVSQAQESATSASASASAASTAATSAGSSASSAASAANRAGSSASAAASSATNAAASAAAAEEDSSEIRNMSATATTLSPGSSATASYSNGTLTLGIPRGNTGSKGNDGNGIDSVTLLSTSGRVKTYRMTFTDGTHFDFSTTDGEDSKYTSGAVVNIGACVFAGYLDVSKNLYFHIPLNKDLANISSASISTDTSWAIFCAGSVLLSNATLASFGTITCTKNETGVLVKVVPSSTSDLTARQTVSVRANAAKLTLS